jgi:5-dehydro-2-deoxygluconokinase
LPKKILGNRFLVLGRAGLDLYADPPGVKMENALRFTSALGGSAANIATAITRLGGCTSLISTLSDDSVGRSILKQLSSYEIYTKFVNCVKGEARSSLAVVESRIENCQSVIYRNGAADFQLEDSEISNIPYEEYSALIVTGTALALEPSRSSTLKAMSLAKKARLVVVLDVDYRPYSWRSESEAAEICLRAVELCDYVVGNDVEFAVLAQGKNGKQFAENIAYSESKTVIYKMGEHGSITYDASTSFMTPIFKVDALKPTGAGDAFMGGLMQSLTAGYDLEAAVSRGSACAAIVVTRVGCAPAMPTPTELETFLQNAKK